ncbi:hypothetical protein F4808DRAFT_428635 [Astrocystis sublimbata]|nr:hypothetical protein F4808DRAFT_428635 [Astrocystis sublimbata]
MGSEFTVQQSTVQTDESAAVDLRPVSSPYASPLITLLLQDGPPFAVPIQFVNKSPKLSSCITNDMRIQLPHVSENAGHVLVHYLFTGLYECLQPKGSDCREKDAAEFAASAQVYALAREYGITDLEALAKGEIEKFGNRLQAVRVLEVLKEALPNLGANDIWFQDYLKSLVRPLLDEPPASLNSLPNSHGQTLSIASALLKVVVELWHEKTCPLTPYPHDLDIGQEHHQELYVETEPATDLQYHLAGNSEYLPDDDNVGIYSKKGKKEKKSKKKVRKERVISEADVWGVPVEGQRSGAEGEEQQVVIE